MQKNKTECNTTASPYTEIWLIQNVVKYICIAMRNLLNMQVHLLDTPTSSNVYKFYFWVAAQAWCISIIGQVFQHQ